MNSLLTFPNREEYLFTNVPLGLNQTMESLNLRENEVWYDEDGLIRLFSMRFEDDIIGNFMLMPKNKPVDVALKIIRDFLVPLGLSYTGNKIFNQNTRVDNVGKFIYNTGGKVFLQDLVNQQIHSNLGYVAMDNGEIVFRSSMTISMGTPLSKLVIKIINKFNQNLQIDTSRDGTNWKPFEILAGQEFSFHFGNAQKFGYVRLNTMTGYLSYKIEARNVYNISWNLNKGHVDLFIE